MLVVTLAKALKYIAFEISPEQVERASSHPQRVPGLQVAYREQGWGGRPPTCGTELGRSWGWTMQETQPLTGQRSSFPAGDSVLTGLSRSVLSTLRIEG